MKKFKLFGFTMALALLVSSLVLGSAIAAGDLTWSTKAPMPTARYSLAMSEVNGKIYAIGGFNDEAYPINTVEEYEPSTDTWTTKASMPTARASLAAEAVNGKIYAIGGITGRYGLHGILNTVEEYNPATDTWVAKSSMPTIRQGMGTAVVDGKIYVIGGNVEDGWGGLTTVEQYNPSTDTWTTKASMPTPRNFLATAVVSGKIYAIGGSNHTDGQNEVEQYDPATDSWTSKSPLPTARYALAGVAVNNKIYAIGGYGNRTIFNTVEEYDPVTNTWTTGSPISIGRVWLSATVVKNSIYVIGGADSTGALNVNEVATVETTIPATVDIKPDSLNVKSKSDKNAVTAYIELPEGYDVREIDIATIALNFNSSSVKASLKPTRVEDYDKDGISDLMVKFKRQEVINALTAKKGNVQLTINGKLKDGTNFSGSDNIKVINKIFR